MHEPSVRAAVRRLPYSLQEVAVLCCLQLCVARMSLPKLKKCCSSATPTLGVLEIKAHYGTVTVPTAWCAKDLADCSAGGISGRLNPPSTQSPGSAAASAAAAAERRAAGQQQQHPGGPPLPAGAAGSGRNLFVPSVMHVS